MGVFCYNVLMIKEHEVHFEGKIAQKVIVEDGDKVLLVQDSRGGDDIWELPGGRMNVDEDPRDAVLREFEEEMGSGIYVHEVVHMEQFIQGNEGARAFVIVYRATLKDPQKGFNVADDEVSQVGWFTQAEIADLKLYSEYQNALDAYFS